MSGDPSKPPPGLQAPGRALWQSVTGWKVDDSSLDLRPDEVAVLAEACAVADTIATLEIVIASEEFETTVAGSRGQTIVNPVLAELRQQRALLAVLLRQLHLPDGVEAADDWARLSPTQRARKAARARWSG